MTNAKPELVERKLPIIEADKITLRYSQEYVDQLNARHSALILQLTAERDNWKTQALFWTDQTETKALEHHAAEAQSTWWRDYAEKLVQKHLEDLKRHEASNKLLSERVAVLEKERDALADQAQHYMDVTKEYFSDTVYDENGLLAEADAALHVTLYNLRRARTALEGK